MSLPAAAPVGPFATFDHRRRVENLRALLDESNDDAWLFADLTDIRWLTGFSGSNAWVVLRRTDLTLGTDARYGERAASETAGSGAQVIVEQQRSKLNERRLQVLSGCASVALDPATTTHSVWTELAKDVSLSARPSPIMAARQVKDVAEVERISAAAAAADAALIEVESMLTVDNDQQVSEQEIRNQLEYRMRLHGADDRSYATIVASGPQQAARPHHEPNERVLVNGDTVIIDVGALVDGYHSDMTRSYVIGEPTDEQRHVYGLVCAAHQAGIAALRSGITAHDVDAVCRDLATEAGYADWYLHGTGHGVGLEIHESPFHSPSSSETIVAGNVVTIEPGLYREGFGGFRIEDLILVTEDGSQSLTHAPKRPFPDQT